jgi:serine protease Do
MHRLACLGLVASLLLAPACRKDARVARVDRGPYRPWIQGLPGRHTVGGRVTTESGFAPLADELKPAVVNLYTELPVRTPRADPEADPEGDGPAAPPAGVRNVLGSGAIISPEGYILTNRHVVDGADAIRVRLADGSTFNAAVVGSDDRYDLGLIKVTTDRPLPTVTLGDSDALRVGQWLIVIGNPFGLQHSVTVGIVSAKDRQIGNGPYDDFIQTDASINPGNSGGPIFDVTGQVVAIARSTRRGAQGIGFAVPVNTAKRFVEEVLAKGAIVRGWLGVSTQDVTPELARVLGIPAEPGVLVTQVVAGSPADAAGLRRGDLVRSVAGRPVTAKGEFSRVMGMTRVGDVVDLVVVRGGKDLSARATMVAKPVEPVAASPAPPPTGLGLVLAERAPGELPTTPRGGLSVVHVAPDGPAERAGMQDGDLVVEVDREAVTSMAAWERRIAATPSGGTLLLLVARPSGDEYLMLKKP